MTENPLYLPGFSADTEAQHHDGQRQRCGAGDSQRHRGSEAGGRRGGAGEVGNGGKIRWKMDGLIGILWVYHGSIEFLNVSMGFSMGFIEF